MHALPLGFGSLYALVSLCGVLAEWRASARAKWRGTTRPDPVGLHTGGVPEHA